MTLDADILIIGAGPSGSSSATFLARNGIKVLLLDKSCFPRNKICGDGLTPRAVSVIERLGVLAEVTKISQRIDKAKIISPKGTESLHEMKDIDDGSTYMLATPRYDLDNVLLQNAISQGAIFKDNSVVKSIDNHDEHVSIRCISEGVEHNYNVKYTIIATGANTSLLKKTGFMHQTPVSINAVTAYFENAHHAKDCFNFHFNDVELPGYGWIFPLPNNRINIGIGVIPNATEKDRKFSGNTRELFEKFIQTPYMKEVLKGATPCSKPLSYPIRTHFPTAKIFNGRTLLVGEAAGLVNPLTGEGIDYAMESGEIAAEHLTKLIQNNTPPSALKHYEQALRDKYMPIFNASNQFISCCFKPFVLNQVVASASRYKSLNKTIMKVVLGLQSPPKKINLFVVISKIIKHFKETLNN